MNNICVKLRVFFQACFFAFLGSEIYLLIHFSIITSITFASLGALGSSQSPHPALQTHITNKRRGRQDEGGDRGRGRERGIRRGRKERKDRGIHGNRLLCKPKVNATRLSHTHTHTGYSFVAIRLHFYCKSKYPSTLGKLALYLLSNLLFFMHFIN